MASGSVNLPSSGISLSTTGTRSSPQPITAAGGITVGIQGQEFQIIAGSGGAVIITANPQISAGAAIGQQLILKGTSDVNTVQISSGTGLELNGNYIMKNQSQIMLIWDGAVWGEVSRNDL